MENAHIFTRELVDLIWFPTGGGKTEAYLALAAFLIFWTRLQDPHSHGCRILMRYTLRLLTSQQFLRAASLICACELIRQKDPSALGEKRITLGLWVGESLSPNNEKDAIKAVDALIHTPHSATNPFQILSCPWCGTTFTDRKQLGYETYKDRQYFVCPNSQTPSQQQPPTPPCPFSYVKKNPLPVCVVDGSIYKNPSSLIIATVDKLAMLARKEDAGRIFHIGGGPDLIIQDELHLITGPLGSMVGLYESVIDYLASLHGHRPKIIASTATIHRAKEQCKALYNRNMFQFPPSGLEAQDCYFASESQKDHKEHRDQSKGRVYMGCFPHAYASSRMAQIRLTAALLQAPFLADTLKDSLIDPYFTLVQYFSTLKDVGRAATFLSDGVSDHMKFMKRYYKESFKKSKKQGKERSFFIRHEELTGRRNQEEIPKILKQLSHSYPHATPTPRDHSFQQRSSSDDDSPQGKHSAALDMVLATSMISVGVDVKRLGVMLMVTQPKSTAEYIQASSRVGRSQEAPGLVITLYNIARPRDRSHYEHFRSYHEAYGYNVEPTSVTPFTLQMLQRALPAVMIIAQRHGDKSQSHQPYPPQHPPEDHLQSFLTFLEKRIHRIDPSACKEFQRQCARILQTWKEKAPEKWEKNIYSSRGFMYLMTSPLDPGAELDDDVVFAVPTSLRNVDATCEAYIPSELLDPFA